MRRFLNSLFGIGNGSARKQKKSPRRTPAGWPRTDLKLLSLEDRLAPAVYPIPTGPNVPDMEIRGDRLGGLSYAHVTSAPTGGPANAIRANGIRANAIRAYAIPTTSPIWRRAATSWP